MTPPATPATPPGGHRFSVVIVHRNGAELLLDALAALAGALREDDEVVLVDNGSGDDSLDRARAAHPGVQIIENGCNAGFARACNQGLAAARGRFALLLNNDARVPPELLDRLQAGFEHHPDAGLLAPALVGEDGAPQRSHGVLPRPWHEVAPRVLRPRPAKLSGHGYAAVEMLVGACLAVRAEAYAQVGGLDADFFFYYEDVEWSRRMRESGWLVLLDQDCRVVHRRGGATRPLRREAQLERFRSRLVYYRKVFPPVSALLLGAYRVARVPLDAAVDALAVAVTLGTRPRPRQRLRAQLYILRWLLAGRPRRWGLPDKCPEAAA